MQIGSAHAQTGAALVALLVVLLVLGLSTQQVAVIVSEQALREREHDSLHIGAVYAQAIQSYYEASPGAVHQWPAELEDLLLDKRFVYTRRHLRKVYKNPHNRSGDWVFLRSDQGYLIGVEGARMDAPTQMRAPEPPGIRVSFSNTRQLWQFVFDPAATAASPTRLKHQR